MGVATVTAGRIYSAQQQRSRYGEESSLAFERFRHVGLSKVGLAIEPRYSFPWPRPHTSSFHYSAEASGKDVNSRSVRVRQFWLPDQPDP